MFVTFLKTTYVHVNDAVKRRELYLIPIKNYDELKSGTQYRQKSTICPVSKKNPIPVIFCPYVYYEKLIVCDGCE